MKLSQFKISVPDNLIATHPAKNREDARLMVLDRKTGKIEHKKFKDILNYFDDGDCMIVNNTRVFPARLYGNKEKTGAKIEVFLLRELNRESRLWDVLVDPARKIRIGNKLYFGDDDLLVAEVIDNTTSRGRTLRFLFDGPYEEFKKTVLSLGQTPLPKYIKRKAEPEDADRYQTVFARHEGAVAAPTAGLHFSMPLVKRLELKGVHFAEMTLHVGLGTFRPVEVEDLTKHKMDSEQVIVPKDCCDIVNKAKTAKKRICAVGTTVMRGVETSVSTQGELKPFDGWTNKFIFPPYDFSIANCMITNFHMPESTLLMMVAAFGGYEHIMHAYKVAVKEKYRFYSYGDAMLKQHAFRYFTTQRGVFFGIFQKIHDFHHLFFRFIQAGYVGKRDVDPGIIVEQGCFGFTDVKNLCAGAAAAAAHAAQDKYPQAHQQQQRKEVGGNRTGPVRFADVPLANDRLFVFLKALIERSQFPAQYFRGADVERDIHLVGFEAPGLFVGLAVCVFILDVKQGKIFAEAVFFDVGTGTFFIDDFQFFNIAGTGHAFKVRPRRGGRRHKHSG